MSGNRIGALKTAKIVTEKYGEDYYAKIGKSGGLVKTPKGFAVSGKAQMAGRKGGANSTRKIVLTKKQLKEIKKLRKDGWYWRDIANHMRLNIHIVRRRYKEYMQR